MTSGGIQRRKSRIQSGGKDTGRHGEKPDDIRRNYQEGEAGFNPAELPRKKRARFNPAEHEERKSRIIRRKRHGKKRASGGGAHRTRRGKSDSNPLAELAGTGQRGAGIDESRMASGGTTKKKRAGFNPEEKTRKMSLARFLIPIHR